MSWISVDEYPLNAMNGGCLICGFGEARKSKGKVEPILASGVVTDDFAGEPVICGSCIEEAGRMVGMVSGTKYAKEQAKNKALAEEVEELKTQLTDKTGAIRALTRELETSAQ